MSHFYGMIPDVRDERDHLFANHPLMGAVKLPSSTNNRAHAPAVRDQGQLGSCTGFSITTMLAALEHKETAKALVFSPLFEYWQERHLEGTVNQDAGAMIRDGVKCLAQIGCCLEADDPYNIAHFTATPSSKATQDAAAYKITSYQRVQTITEMKTALAGGFAFVLGFSVPESFESQAMARTGIMAMPLPGESFIGGHAVCAIDYKDDPKRPGGGDLIIQNSWSAGWGDHGYFHMPYQFATNKKLVSDNWVALK